MSDKVQILRSMVEQRLTAATEEIFGMFERAIAEHEEEFCRTKEENRRLRQMLDEVLKPTVPNPAVSHSDIQVVQVVKEEQQVWSPVHVQEAPQLPRIKEEEREVYIQEQIAHSSQLPAEDGHMTHIVQFDHGQEYEGSDTYFPSDTENTDNSSDSESSTFHPKQKRRRQAYIHPKMAPPTSSFCPKIKTEANGDNYGNPTPGSSVKPDCQTDSDKTENSSDSECDGSETAPKRGKSKSKRHQCADCNRVFSTGQFVKKQKKSSAKTSHTGRKWISCPICRKTFFHKADVERHMKVHTQGPK